MRLVAITLTRAARRWATSRPRGSEKQLCSDGSACGAPHGDRAGFPSVRRDPWLSVLARPDRVSGLLSSSSEFTTAYQRNLRAAGRYVALGQAILGKGRLSYNVNVFDLRRARRLSTVTPTGVTTPAARSQTHGDAYGIGPTTNIELRATGQVAWIAKDVYTPGPPRYEIHKREGARTTRLAAGRRYRPRVACPPRRSPHVAPSRPAGKTTLGPAPR